MDRIVIFKELNIEEFSIWVKKNGPIHGSLSFLIFSISIVALQEISEPLPAPL